MEGSGNYIGPDPADVVRTGAVPERRQVHAEGGPGRSRVLGRTLRSRRGAKGTVLAPWQDDATWLDALPRASDPRVLAVSLAARRAWAEPRDGGHTTRGSRQERDPSNRTWSGRIDQMANWLIFLCGRERRVIGWTNGDALEGI